MLDPLYTLISWVLLTYHGLLNTFLPADSGINWALSIVLLVLTMRAVLFPLFVKQIKSQRRMQAIQPQMKELREKYKNDRETLNREMSTLLRENNANPITGCLPMLVQIPVFMSLFHVLRYIGPEEPPLYGWTQAEMTSASFAKLFGAPISAAFTTPVEELQELGATQTAVHVVTGTFIALMALTTFLTQRQMLARSRATSSESQVQTVQKMLMYVIPISLIMSGPFFPLGVLIYWTTANLFSLGQQQYVIRSMHEAEEKKKQAELEAKLNPVVKGPRPGAKPVNPKKGGGGKTTAPGSAAATPTAPTAGPQKAGPNTGTGGGTSGSRGKAKGSPSGDPGGGPNPSGRPPSAGPSPTRKDRKGGTR